MKSDELSQPGSTGTSCAQSVCEACGETFGCGASLSGCWCVEVKLTDAVRARLRERYEGCLCRGCLERAADGEDAQGAEKIFSEDFSREPENSRARTRN
ncbi:MAG: cysteine-rich CWC family protein [Pyrinomonadaceae bacterium]|nr:cysteine-rich CWC family protein [Pyrinomonadaceae bacterium]